MRIKKVKREWTDRIRDLLEDCDLVKFAKYIPSEKEIDEAYSEARELIKITTPVPGPGVALTRDGGGVVK